MWRPGGPFLNKVRVHDEPVIPDPMTTTSTWVGKDVLVDVGTFTGGIDQNDSVGLFTGKPGERSILSLTARYSASS